MLLEAIFFKINFTELILLFLNAFKVFKIYNIHVTKGGNFLNIHRVNKIRVT